MSGTPTQRARRVADRYTLARPIGRGGMGTVWLATDDLLRRPVAVKEVELPAALGDDDRSALRRRVMREARAAASIHDPRVVTIFDARQEEGRAFIVMELVDAPTLDELVRDRGPLDPAEVARVGLDVLGALETAHAAGVVHRDIKPSNVLCPAGGPAKLTDFGIASIQDDPRITSTGVVVGSPKFMSPEQARGRAPTPATDLWSLGATLYFALEARAPFERDGPLATMQAIVTEDAPAIPDGGGIGGIVGRLLAKDPEGRPAIAAVRAALEPVAAGGAPAQELGDTSPLEAVAPPAGHSDDGRTGAGSLAIDGRNEAAGPSAGAGPDPAAGPSAEAGPDPAAGPSAASGAPVRPRNRRPVRARVWAALGLAGAAAAIAVALAVAGDDQPPARPDRGGRSGRAEPGSGARIPAGWERYADEDAGYSVAYPPGWEVAPVSDTITDFRDPAGGRYVRVDWTSEPGPSPEGAWEDLSASLADSKAGYEEIRIEPATYKGYDAAILEFTYSEGGADLHAVDLGFVTGERGYALNFQTTADTWDRSQALFDRIKAGFEVTT